MAATDFLSALSCTYPKEGVGHGVQTTPGKSQVAICFLRNTDGDPLEKQLDPMGSRSRSNHISSARGTIASGGRSVRPYMKYVPPPPLDLCMVGARYSATLEPCMIVT